jgi:hypothetical protein
MKVTIKTTTPLAEMLLGDFATLYANDEAFANQTFIGTRERFREALEPLWFDWYSNYVAQLSDETHPISLSEYIEDSLDTHLTAASDDEIATHKRL